MSEKCQTRATNCRFIRSPRQLSRIHPAKAAESLFEQCAFFVHFDEINEVLDSEVRDGHHAVFADAVDPYHTVFDVHFVGDVG